jgi:hypothetical protein
MSYELECTVHILRGLSAADRASLMFEVVKIDISANGCFE